MHKSHIPDHLDAAVRDGVARAVGVAGLLAIGLIHLLDVQGKFSETPYMAWMYIGLMIGCIFVAAELVRTGSRLAWAAAGGLAASAAIGYVLTRTVGLPQAHGDVGNWSEPLGLASLLAEGLLVVLSAAMVTARRALRVPVAQPAAARAARIERPRIAA